MPTTITVNLPVKDLAKSTAFFTNLGFAIHPMFAEEKDMELLVISDAVSVMLNSESRFRGISGKDLVDSATSAEAVMQLRVESRDEVDQLVDKALASGGVRIHEPNDQGYLYGRSFQDLDRHNWDVFFVDASASPA